MNPLPRITLITPSLNQGKFIESTVRSILDQQYPDLEYIVMDGGSTDETASIVGKYAGMLQWSSEPDRGQAHAINKGLQKATGEVIGYLNSDDELEPGSLQAVGLFFQTHPQADWLTGYCRIMDERGKEIRKAVTAYKNAWLRFPCRTTLLILNYVSQPATFWRRRMLDQVGLLDESLTYTMDCDYWLRIGKTHPLWVQHRYLARFRIHASSKSGATFPAQFREEMGVTRRYTRSAVLLLLHRLHNRLILAVYRHLAHTGTSMKGPSPQ